MEQKTEASQAVDEPFPPMPLPVAKHAVVGDLFDCFAMQQYAMRYADLVVAALKAQPAPTEETEKPFAYFIVEGDDLPYPGSGFIRELAEGRVYRSVTPVYTRPAPTEAAQGNTSNNSSSSQLSGNSGELAQGEDSARLDAQVTAAARVLANRSADGCGVNREDNWNIYSQEFIEDARAALDAARASAETGGVKL